MKDIEITINSWRGYLLMGILCALLVAGSLLALPDNPSTPQRICRCHAEGAEQ